MDHRLTESQELLRQTAESLFSRDYPLDRMRAIQASEQRYSPELWATMCELGWAAAPFPEEVGGFEGSFADAAVLLEQMGRGAAVTPYVHSVVAAGLALVAEDPGLAARIATGEAVVVPVMPPAGRPGGGLHVERGGDALVLSGTVAAVPWTPLATHLLVGTGGQWALVEANAGGVTARPLAASTGEPLSMVTFDGVEGRALAPRTPISDPLLLGAAGQALALAGMSSRALEVAVAYAGERVQFGRLIGSFQAIQHRCADMHVAAQTASRLGHKAAWAHRASPDTFERSARYAKAFAGDAAAFVTRQAIQVHGGVGFIDNHRVQLFYLGAIAAASTYGTSQEHREAIAESLLAKAVV